MNLFLPVLYDTLNGGKINQAGEKSKLKNKESLQMRNRMNDRNFIH